LIGLAQLAHGEVKGPDGTPRGDGLVHQTSGSGLVELPQQRLPEAGRGVTEDAEQLE